MNPTNTDSNAAADSATATNEPEGFESFERRQLGLFREVESIAASWGLAVVIRDFRRGRTSAAALALLVGTSAHRTPKHPDAARCFALIAADLEHIFAQEFERGMAGQFARSRAAHAAAAGWERLAAMGSHELPPCDVSVDALREEFRKPMIPQNLPPQIAPGFITKPDS
jgi:hypothetical protein